MIRTVVAQLWTGARVVQRLGPDDPTPSPPDLDAIGVAWTAWNDGVKPVVRVLEQSTVPTASLGAAGSVPR